MSLIELYRMYKQDRALSRNMNPYGLLTRLACDALSETPVGSVPVGSVILGGCASSLVIAELLGGALFVLGAGITLDVANILEKKIRHSRY